MPDEFTDPSNAPETQDGEVQKAHTRRSSSVKKSVVGGLLLLVLICVGFLGVVQFISTNKSRDESVLRTEIVTIYLTKDGFVPATVQIKPGTQVVWTNKDTTSHEIFVGDKNAQPLDISQRLAPGESFSTVLDEEKDYYVRSRPDGDTFKGVIMVKSKVVGDE